MRVGFSKKPVGVRGWIRLSAASALSVCLLGCAATGGSSGAVGASRSNGERLAADVDPQRAFLSLSEIVPDAAPPSPNAAVPPLSERAAAQLARARSLVAEQRFTEATIALDRALRFDPKHPAVHAALASLHWDLGNIERARTHAEQAVSGNPDEAEAHYILGRIALSCGEYDAAIRALRRAQLCSDIQAAPMLAVRTDFHLAAALAEAGYLEAAIASYRRVVERSESADHATKDAASFRTERRSARTAMATLYDKLGRFSQAADALAPVAGAFASDPSTTMRYVRLLIKAKRFEAALKVADTLPVDNDEVLDLLADIHKRSGHPERIIDELRTRLRAAPGSARLAGRLADELEAAGRSDEARGVLLSFLDRKPDAHGVRLKLIAGLIDAARWNEVLTQAAAGVTRPGAPLDDYDRVAERLASIPTAVEALLDNPAGGETGGAGRLYLLGLLARRADRSALAERFLSDALAQDDAFVAARATLGEMFLSALRFNDAIRVASRGKDEVPDNARLAFILGRAYAQLDDSERAELNLRAVTQLDRENLDAMLALAEVYRRSGRSNLARRQLQVLIEQAPSFDAAREALAVIFMKEGKFDEAFAQVREMKRYTKSLLVKARCDTLLDPELRRDSAARRAALQRAIDAYGGDAVTWIAVAETYDEFEPAPRRKAYLHALEQDPNNEDAMWGLVDAEQRLLLFEDAAGHLEELLRHRPNRDVWRLALLDAYSVLGRDEAILEATRAQEDRPNVKGAHRREYRSRLIKALRRLGRDDEILTTLEGWVAKDPDTATWALWLADEYLMRKKPDRAVAIYRRAYEDQPQEWGAVASLADALVKAGRADRAAQYVLDRMNDDPESDQGTWMLAGVMSDSGEDRAAIELIQNRLQRTRNREAFQDLLIGRYRRTNRFDAAIELIESLMDEVVSMMHRVGRGRPVLGNLEADADVALRPNEPFNAESLARRLVALRLQLGQALILDKQYRIAEERVTDWLEGTRDTGERVRLLWLLAGCQRERGNPDQANDTLRRALLLQPENVSFNNDVAYTLIDKGVELDDAEKMIRFAVWRAPEQPAYLDTYGWLLYKQRKYADALKWTQRALRNQREPDAVILDHLGDIAWQAGAQAEAVTYWERAVERVKALDPDRPRTADEQRVREQTAGKIKAVRSGATPHVAPLGKSDDDGNEGGKEETKAAVGTKL